MEITTVVVASDDDATREVSLEDRESVEVLGVGATGFGATLTDVFTAIVNPIQEAIAHESEVVVELSGSVDLKADGKMKWLLLNIGGSASAKGAVKIVVRTKVKPGVGGRARSASHAE